MVVVMKDTTTFPELIDIVEASRALGRSVETLRQWDKSKKLVAIRLATRGKRMYKRSDIEKLVQQ